MDGDNMGAPGRRNAVPCAWCLAAVLLAGCAGSATVPTGAHHPADPAAAAGPMPDRVVSAPDERGATNGAKGHRDMRDMSSMDHDAMPPAHEASEPQAGPDHEDEHYHHHSHAAEGDGAMPGEQIARLPDPQNGAVDVDRVIAVTAVDIGFEPDTVRVRHGETVRFVVTNEGAVEHEFIIGDRTAQVAHAAEMAAMEPGMDHSHMGNAISLKPGETKELTWTVASHDLQFACHVPGHYDAGMWGEIELVR